MAGCDRQAIDLQVIRIIPADGENPIDKGLGVERLAFECECEFGHLVNAKYFWIWPKVYRETVRAQSRHQAWREISALGVLAMPISKTQNIFAFCKEDLLVAWLFYRMATLY